MLKADPIRPDSTKPTAKRRARAAVLSTEDPELANAAKARAEAENAVYKWRDKVLPHPFTISRETLFYSLRVHAGAPSFGQLMTNQMAFLGDALRILFLCSHAPEEFDHYRSEPAAFLAAIEAWGDANVTREENVALVTLGWKIFNDSTITAAVPVPRDGNNVGE
jgi:hypothetical protein